MRCVSYKAKKLQQRVTYLSARNEELKQKVRDLERELAVLRAGEPERSEELEEVKKGAGRKREAQGLFPVSQGVVASHSYALGQNERRLDLAQLEQKLGWIKDYREDLSDWEALWILVRETESFVRNQGLYRGARQDLKIRLAFLAPTAQSKRIRKELLSFVACECRKAKTHERLLGSSQIIESVFGKLKNIEKHQSGGGFTALVPSIAAIVSKTTSEVIRTAMETVRTKDVIE